MTKRRKKGRWSVEQRLAFVDFRLYWEGHINRADLVAFFGVSVPQASADLARYQEQAKNNAAYDKTRKAYVAGPKFKPVFFEPSADDYLAQVRLVRAGVLSEDEAWAVPLPSYSVVPIPRRKIDPATLRRVLDAIRTRAAVHVRYQSMSRTEPIWRWIAPHALAFDGFRWHVRAWCHRREVFHDFLLARALEVGEARPSGVDPAGDAGWHREVTLRIGPHPALLDGKRRAIELDFGMADGVAEVTTRVCLSAYVERNLGLDLDPAKIPPERQQIVLLNKDEIEAARREVAPAGDPASEKDDG